MKTTKQYLIQYLNYGQWYDYSARYNTLNHLKKELNYLIKHSTTSRLIQRTTTIKDKVIK